jgi:hypothetical protein
MSRLTLGMILGLALGVGVLAAQGCTPGEGERCNPLLFNVNDQCTNGLQCTYPKYCGVAYCCPPTLTPMTSSHCQPCPPPDGGTRD